VEDDGGRILRERLVSDQGAQLAELQRRQRLLAWLLSLLVFGVTVGFFALMGLNVQFLSHIVFGQWITVANVLAALIVVVLLLSVALFGHLASRIDALANIIQKRNR
jgi:uncharacterized membrane protein (DUF485 family)